MKEGAIASNPFPSTRSHATSLARAIEKHRNALLDFFGGKSTQAQSCQGFSLLELEEIAFAENNARIKPIPLHVAAPTRHHKTLPKPSGNFSGVKALKPKPVKGLDCHKSREYQLKGKAIGLCIRNATSLARAIGKRRTALLQFLEGKSPQAKSCQGFSLLQIEDIAVVVGGACRPPSSGHIITAMRRVLALATVTNEYSRVRGLVTPKPPNVYKGWVSLAGNYIGGELKNG